MDQGGSLEIAKRARGTPRLVNRILKRVRDFAQVKGDGCITQELAREALSMMEIDHQGFDVMDRKLLLTLIEKFGGGPVGLETLSAALSEEKGTLEEVYEPFLLQKGFLERTPRGRMATETAYRHFGFTPVKREGQPSLL